MSDAVVKTIPFTEESFLLFDEQFSIENLQQEIFKEESDSEYVLSAVRKAVKKATEHAREDPQSVYVVDFTPEIKEKIAAGEFSIDKNSAGELFAQLRDANGKYSDKLPIKEELLEQGVSVEAVELALQMDVIKDQLKEIISALNSIQEQITEVIQGQQNDRLGLFYSGLCLYLEASSVNDPYLKKQIIAQALKSIGDANAQMIQEIRTNIEFLVSERYKRSKKITEIIEEKISTIRQCYDIVYRAAFLKTKIYHDCGELSAMLTAIDEYGRFIEKMIVPYVGKLSELDRHDQFIDKGTWGTIANTLTNSRDLKQMISQKRTYYLSFEEAG